MASNNATNTSNPVNVSQGGTGLATLTLHSLQCGNGTGNVTQIAVGATGTVLIGTTATDPSFSATPSVTSITLSSGTALSSYVEGTFTPTIDGATPGSTTYTSQNGYYTRIGNIVYVQGSIVITAATGTGNATLAALPFTVKNQTNGNTPGEFVISGTGWAWPAARTMVSLNFVANTLTATVNTNGTATTSSLLQMANAAATFTFSGVYQI